VRFKQGKSWDIILPGGEEVSASMKMRLFLSGLSTTKPHFVKTIFLLLNSRKQLKKRMASCLNHDIVLPESFATEQQQTGNYFKTCQS
jgi:hypothetical protein